MLFGIEQGSGLLHALGMAIVHSFWQSLLLWGIYHVIIFLRKNASPAKKHNLAIAFVLGAFIWFGITFFTGLQQQQITNEWLKGNSEIIVAANSSNFIQWDILIPYLSLSYLVLLVFFLFRFCRSYFSAKRVLFKELHSAPAILQHYLDTARKHSGVRRKVTLWLSRHITVPGTIGFLKPIILMPVAALNQLSQEQLEAIILHELSHIRRNDYILNLLLSIVEVFLFFNPFIYLWMKVIRRERENCCDDFVLQRSYDSVSYAEALMQLASLKPVTHSLSMGAVSGNHQLLHRIIRITGGQLKMHHYRNKLMAMVCTMGILIACSYLAFRGKSTKSQEQKLAVNSDLKKEINNGNLLLTRDKTYEPLEQKEENTNNITGDRPKDNFSLWSLPIEPGAQPESTPENENPDQWEKFMTDVQFSGRLSQALQQAQVALKQIDWDSVSKEVGKALEEIDWRSINRKISAVQDSIRYLKLGVQLQDKNLQRLQRIEEMSGKMKEKQKLLQNIQKEMEGRQMMKAKELLRNKDAQMEYFQQYKSATIPHVGKVVQGTNVPNTIHSSTSGVQSHFNPGQFHIQIDSLQESRLFNLPNREKMAIKILRRMDI